VRFVIIGGGPGGNSAASGAARRGAQVTLIERDVVGGAAHLWDCIPSKAMIASGGAMSFVRRSPGMGLGQLSGEIDLDGMKRRVVAIEERLHRSVATLLTDQGVRLISGTGRLAGPHQVVAEVAGGPGGATAEGTGTEEVLEADAILLATGSRPRIPDWAHPDGDRILTTRQAYPPPTLPGHVVVIGSGVTGVEFVHMFASLGSEVTLVVSRQHVLPNKDPEVAQALEDEFVRRGVRLLKGARAVGIDRTPDGSGGGVVVRCDDGRVARGTHALLAVGSVPNSEHLGLEAAGVETDRGYVTVNQHCQSNVRHIYAAGDLSGKLPLSSVASMQGRKIAEHVMHGHLHNHRHLDYDKAAQAVFTEPEIAEVGIAEAEAFATGRKIRVTKVPFSSNAKALINDDWRGFVKIVSDPNTGVVLGGSIVGGHAAELISVIALAVNCGLKVSDVVDCLLVHPSLGESLAEAAE
jgi:dihydrolipoamide dehydrogenase